jgi:hypothetical protein
MLCSGWPRIPRLGEGNTWAEGILWGNSLIWDGKVGCEGVREETADTWYPAFVDPTSLTGTSEEVLGLGELAPIHGARKGVPSSWYYPARKGV